MPLPFSVQAPACRSFCCQHQVLPLPHPHALPCQMLWQLYARNEDAQLLLQVLQRGVLLRAADCLAVQGPYWQGQHPATLLPSSTITSCYSKSSALHQASPCGMSLLLISGCGR